MPSRRVRHVGIKDATGCREVEQVAAGETGLHCDAAGVHPPVITARHARFPCCAAGHDPDGGCRPRCRRNALIHMRIRGTTSVVPLVRSVSLRVCFSAITSARQPGISWYCGCFLPAAAEVAHERPAVTGKLGGGHLRQGQLSFQRRHQPWFRSASSPACRGARVHRDPGPPGRGEEAGREASRCHDVGPRRAAGHRHVRQARRRWPACAP